MALAKGNNPNHPQLGDIIKVDPIRDLKAIKRIKTLLASNPTHSALFQVGINTAFRASDLLRLTPAHVTGNVITIREQKTGKVRTVTVNEPTLQA
jgi:integrase